MTADPHRLRIAAVFATMNRAETAKACVMALARQVDVWECRFAPELTALPALARAVRDHMDQE